MDFCLHVTIHQSRQGIPGFQELMLHGAGTEFSIRLLIDPILFSCDIGDLLACNEQRSLQFSGDGWNSVESIASHEKRSLPVLAERMVTVYRSGAEAFFTASEPRPSSNPFSQQ